MDGLRQQYKQIQSFGLSSNPLKGDFANRNAYPNYSKVGPFNNLAGFGINTCNVNTFSVSEFGSFGTAGTKYTFAVEVPNGYIYMGGPGANLLKLSISDESSSVTAISTALNIGVVWKNFIVCQSSTAPNTSLRYVDWTNGDKIDIVPFGEATPTGLMIINGLMYSLVGNGTNAKICIWDIDSRSMVDKIFIPNSGVTASRWLGFANDGRYIYYAPFNENYYLKFDTITYQFENLTTGLATGGSLFQGLVYHPVTKLLYSIPSSHTNPQAVDFQNKVVRNLGSSLGAGVIKYTYCTISITGEIIASGRNSTTVLKISPYSESVIAFGSLTGDNTILAGRHHGIIQCSNGNLYCTPYQSQYICKISPAGRVNADPNWAMNTSNNRTQ